MKREILFRGKAIKNTFSINEKEAKIKIGDWIYGAVIPFDDGIDLIYERDTNNPKICGCHGIEVDHNTVGQFTGLHDKNGTKIFEGDIIQTEFSKSIVKFGEYQRINAQSGYRNGDIGFYAYHIDETQRGCVRNDLLYFNEQCEVIGNIHDK